MGAVQAILMRTFGRPRGLLGRLGGRIMAGANEGCGRWVAELLEVDRHASVLEVGFGSGVVVGYLAELAPDGYVAGIDASREMVEQAAARNAAAIDTGRVDLRHAEVAYLPFGDDRFDAALSINSLQVWPDPDVGLYEIFRALRPDGRVALGFTPQSGQSPDGLTKILAAAGFAEPQVVSRGTWTCALARKP